MIPQKADIFAYKGATVLIRFDFVEPVGFSYVLDIYEYGSAEVFRTLQGGVSGSNILFELDSEGMKEYKSYRFELKRSGQVPEVFGAIKLLTVWTPAQMPSEQVITIANIEPQPDPSGFVPDPNNVLIYDDYDTNHYNNVKTAYDYYFNGTANHLQYFVGFGGNWNIALRQFCKNNDVGVVVVPWGSISTRDALQNLILDGIVCVIPYYEGISQFDSNIYFASTIRIQEGETGTAAYKSLDFTSTIPSAVGVNSTPSYVTAKVAAMAANLMNQGYDAWQARQILRQNADAFDNWTLQNGFGKLPETITIPDTILDIPATTVAAFGFGFNQVITFRSPSGTFEFAGLSLTDPITDTRNRYNEEVSYTQDYETQYGEEFASITVVYAANPDGIDIESPLQPPLIV